MPQKMILLEEEMKFVIFILNLPLTLMGVIPLILAYPYSFKLIKNPIAFVFKVKKFWFPIIHGRNARALTIGHIILMGPRLLRNDLEHEIIHVKQAEKYPFIFPFLYGYELLKNGSRMNRFEDEAYALSNSIYEGPKKSS